jgi:hypothetical protein
MGSETKSDVRSNQERFHLSLASLFRLQLLVSPLFLSAYYGSLGPRHGFHPYLLLIAALIAPLIYVTLLVASQAPLQGRHQRRTVIVQIFQGGLYGVLFCVLALGPLAVLYAIELATSFHVPSMLEFCVVIAYVLLHYVVIGSLVGGLVGIARDVVESIAHRHEPASTQYPVLSTARNAPDTCGET